MPTLHHRLQQQKRVKKRSSMELVFILIGIGVVAALNALAMCKLDDRIQQEHKKTRKDQQEIKTRLIQVRKDFNSIERK